MKIYLRIIYSLIIMMVLSCETETVPDEVEVNEITEEVDETSLKAGRWRVVFADYFTKGGNLNKWQKTNRADYNSNRCKYRSGNPRLVTFDNRDCLELSAYKSGNNYISGHVKSNFSFKPGRNQEYRVTSRIKLIARQGRTYKGFAQTYGAWPAFWTVNESNWPVGGEIDIMEGYSFGNRARFASNLFYGTQTGQNLLGSSGERGYSVGEGWHKYEQFWRNENGRITVRIVVDNKQVAFYRNSTNRNLKLENFNRHNVILNLNVGSDTGIFDNSQINLFSRTYMYIDGVSVHRRSL